MGEFLIAGMFWQQVLNGTVDVDRRDIWQAAPSVEVSDWQKKENRNFYLRRAQSTRQRIRERNDIFSKSLQTSTFHTTAEKIKTTLVIAPHPDDEILCCSRTISEKISAGENVKIVYLTDGDALAGEDFSSARAYGDVRRNESQLATQKLGLSSDDLAFLGFPDGHLSDLDKRGSVRSSFTGRRISSNDSYFPNSPYTRIRLKENLRKILKRWDPDEIILPSQWDEHDDHRVAGKLVREILAEEGKLDPKILAYTVHRQQCLDERCPADRALDPEKLNLIQIFKSQRHDHAHEIFLDQFASQTEKFESLTSEISASK